MALRTSNPTLNEKAFNRYAYLTGADPSTLMTIPGTLNKCLLLLGIAIITGTFGWILAAQNPGLAVPIAIGSALLAFALVLTASFKVEWSPVLAPTYAVVEGVLLGVVSMIFESMYPGIALQAGMLTVVVLGIMLGLYRAGILRATPMFTKVVVIATASIALVYLGAMIARLFGTQVPFLNDATPLGIGISLVICVVAALNFILDFDTIEKGAANGAPKFMEWYAGLGLMVTIFWLYLELLRLLAKLRR